MRGMIVEYLPLNFDFGTNYMWLYILLWGRYLVLYVLLHCVLHILIICII
jgi:hypothetical protein